MTAMLQITPEAARRMWLWGLANDKLKPEPSLVDILHTWAAIEEEIDYQTRHPEWEKQRSKINQLALKKHAEQQPYPVHGRKK